MNKLDKLYETFGELLYVLAKADGIIQDEEIEALHKLLGNHPWAKDVEWSFNYEKDHNNDIDMVYKKVIDYCAEYGPTPEYKDFIDVMTHVANASSGIDAEEQKIINSFTNDLTERFKNDIERIN